MNPIDIITKFYTPGTKAYDIFVAHGESVKQKALEVARHVDYLNPDYEFIASAAMLHDVGIFQTHAPNLHCYGMHPYICHGIIGKDMLMDLGLPVHALVCERHVGVGISRHDIINSKLPLPKRDMCPVSLEEEIICYADKFYSKSPPGERSLDDVIDDIKKERYGPDKLDFFMEWIKRFH